MKYLAVIFLIMLISCTEKSTDSNINSTSIPDNIFPLKVGNEWTYYKYKPNNSSEKTSYTVECIKDTLINNEKWFVFEYYHNDSVSVGGDWGIVPFIHYRYFTNRTDGIYVILTPTSSSIDSSLIINFFPINGISVSAVTKFKSKIQISTTKQKYETYLFCFVYPDTPDGGDKSNYYLVPNIGIVFLEADEGDYIKGVYELKDYIIK